MTYWNNPKQEEEEPMSNENKVVLGVGLAFATGDLLLSFSQMNLWYGVTLEAVKPLLFHAVISGVFAGGITFAVVGSIPLLIEWLVKAGVPQTIEDKPKSKIEPPKKAESDSSKQTIEFVSPIRQVEVVGEVWQVHMNNVTLPDGRIRIGTRVVDIPDTVDYDHLMKLAEHRASGGVGSVSTVTLNSIGITRNGKPPNAQSLIEWLLKEGVLKDNGERRPCTFTRMGEKLFPDYTTPLPEFMRKNLSSGATSGATDATATTATASD